MKSKIENIYLFLNCMFFSGILFSVYLYFQENNTTSWIIAEGMIVLGILGAVIPETIINTNMGAISISVLRGTIFNKYIIFCMVLWGMGKFMTLTMLSIALVFLVDMFLEIRLFAQIKSIGISIEQYIEKLKSFDTSVESKMLKCYECYALGILLYLFIHSNVYETIIMLLINIIIQTIVSARLNLMLKCTGKWRIHILLWVIFGLTIFVASLNFRIITYSLVGLYVMISSDSISIKRTSLFNRNFLGCKDE